MWSIVCKFWFLLQVFCQSRPPPRVNCSALMGNEYLSQGRNNAALSVRESNRSQQFFNHRPDAIPTELSPTILSWVSDRNVNHWFLGPYSILFTQTDKVHSQIDKINYFAVSFNKYSTFEISFNLFIL